MAFFQDAPAELRRVHWYYAADKAAMMPWPSVFGSRIYERPEEPQPAIGEQFTPVPWRTGTPPYEVPRGGLCGNEHQWGGGASIADALPPNWPGSSVPRCCSPPVETWTGGTAVGGRPLTAPCCGLTPLPRVVRCLMLINHITCVPLDNIPFIMFPTDHTPAFITAVGGTAVWRSEVIVIDTIGYRWYLACVPSAATWFNYLVEDATDFGFGATTFTTVTCDPFVLTASGISTIINIFPGCVVDDADVTLEKYA